MFFLPILSPSGHPHLDKTSILIWHPDIDTIIWGYLLTALIFSSSGTSPEMLLHPSPGAVLKKRCWRDLGPPRSPQMPEISQTASQPRPLSVLPHPGAGEQRPYTCRLPLKRNAETGISHLQSGKKVAFLPPSSPTSNLSLLVADSDVLKGSTKRKGVGPTSSQGDN